MAEHVGEGLGQQGTLELPVDQYAGWRESALASLERAHGLLAEGQARQGMHTLFAALQGPRAFLPLEEWKRFCQLCRAHPILQLLLEDPLTHRSFARPRGYPGDAVLLDLMYQPELNEQGPVSKTGREIFDFLYGQSNTISLRYRRDLLARRIDEVADAVPEARIVSVAAGHLREAQSSRAVAERRFGQFLAVDQDPESLTVIEQELMPLGIQPVHGSVRALLKQELRFTDQDFIYAAGLYDYLPQPVAISLTHLLFSMLRPGGRLLLANYADNVQDPGCRAYMEAFMDWWLLYREEREVEEWLRDIPLSQLAQRQLFLDGPGNILYLELVRR
ncbi:MAG TPA: class I SAM-dependent methyltransferase [Myxococcaceae bacterium]